MDELEGRVDVADEIANRIIPEVYRSRRKDVFSFVKGAIEKSGGRVLYSSPEDRAPIYFGVQLDSDERLGLLIYAYRFKRVLTRNRPSDEVRAQIRNGSEKNWDRPHPMAFDLAGVDTTLLLGVDLDAELIFGFDAHLYDPLPMGASVYVKDADRDATQDSAWHVWERNNRDGRQRAARSGTNLETIVGFKPDKLLQFASLERRATLLRLDTALRHAAARSIADEVAQPLGRHVLEEEFALSSSEILDVIRSGKRLAVAVKGGIAEKHLERYLNNQPSVDRAVPIDEDGKHDFDVYLRSGAILRVECKNASPNRYANGDFKVEVQKTRDPKGEAGGRLYSIEAFDVVAACIYSATGRWEFRFAATDRLPRDSTYPSRLAAMQRVDNAWSTSLTDLP